MTTDLLVFAHIAKESSPLFNSQLLSPSRLQRTSPLSSPLFRPFSPPCYRPAIGGTPSSRHGFQMPRRFSPLSPSAGARTTVIAASALSVERGRTTGQGLGRGLPERASFGASNGTGAGNNEAALGSAGRSASRREGASEGTRRAERGRAVVAHAVVGGEIALGPAVVAQVIDDLGLDALLFLLTTVIIVPTCKWLKISPILGFLGAGLVFSRLGFGQHVNEIAPVSELGILFLLFQMGIELSVDRLKELAKYSFGLGLSQIAACTLAFAFLLQPADSPISPAHLLSQASSLLTLLPSSLTSLVPALSPLPFSTDLLAPLANITLDEALVIAVALSLSSSAFVLNLLDEHDELETKFGSATLGVLLMQDIAVVPILAILPVLEAVQRANAPEAFLALSLLAVTGTSLATDKLGFSDSLGAFLAGAILSSTPLKHDVALCTGPLQKLLLGLFFVTTGSSIDVDLLVEQWPVILTLLGGLLAVKTATVALLAPRWGLKGKDAIRTALILSPGGEFAFVVLALACDLGVLPTDVNRIVLIVVVLSMALTPALDALGYLIAGIGGRDENDGWLDVELVERRKHGKALPGEGRGLFLPAGVVDVDVGEVRQGGGGGGEAEEGDMDDGSLEELERIASGAIPPPPPLEPNPVFAARSEGDGRESNSGKDVSVSGGGMGGSAAAINPGGGAGVSGAGGGEGFGGDVFGGGDGFGAATEAPQLIGPGD
ncbi:unnamed protein product [Closterium sp. NIES-65]|nr:unnamed protein product [Closterium sp. NIES-65]